MIPKKIHYCWLSNDEMPKKIRQCIESWHKYLPDYEIIRWDLERFPLDKNIWVKQAFERKKYAFAADYIRLYALSSEGGIYLDSDVEVLKPFDDLLMLPYFVCKENSPQLVEAATIGAEANTIWVNECLEYYNGKEFIDSNGNNRVKVLPKVIEEVISKNFKINFIKNISEFNFENQVVNLFTNDYFSPKSYINKKIKITDNSYSIHHFAGTWQPAWVKLILLVWVPFKKCFPNYSTWIKKVFSN